MFKQAACVLLPGLLRTGKRQQGLGDALGPQQSEESNTHTHTEFVHTHEREGVGAMTNGKDLCVCVCVEGS